MLAWLHSDTGEAVSTIVSNGLSFLAILIGVGVALIEQRRANRDSKRELAREREAIERAERERIARNDRLRVEVAALLDRAINEMTTDLPVLGAMYIQWTTNQGKPLELKTLRTTLDSLRTAALDDVDLIFLLVKASAILDATIEARLGTAPTVSAVLHVLREQSINMLKVKRDLIARDHG